MIIALNKSRIMKIADKTVVFKRLLNRHFLLVTIMMVMMIVLQLICVREQQKRNKYEYRFLFKLPDHLPDFFANITFSNGNGSW